MGGAVSTGYSMRPPSMRATRIEQDVQAEAYNSTSGASCKTIMRVGLKEPNKWILESYHNKPRLLRLASS